MWCRALAASLLGMFIVLRAAAEHLQVNPAHPGAVGALSFCEHGGTQA